MAKIKNKIFIEWLSDWLFEYFDLDLTQEGQSDIDKKLTKVLKEQNLIKKDNAKG